MTREEALAYLLTLYELIPNATTEVYAIYKDVQAYVNDSIPTPTVEVVLERTYDKDVSVNGVEILAWATCRQVADRLRAALGIEVKP